MFKLKSIILVNNFLKKVIETNIKTKNIEGVGSLNANSTKLSSFSGDACTTSYALITAVFSNILFLSGELQTFASHIMRIRFI